MGKRKRYPDAAVRKHILHLNNALPEEVGIYWVTAEEMQKRLIHSGVRSSLTVQMVSNALRLNNTDLMFIERRDFGGQIWFRSKAVHEKHKENGNILPHNQRFKRKGGPQKRLASCINPARGYFRSVPNRHFASINTELEKLEQKMKEERQREDEERERQMSELILIESFRLANSY